MAKVVRRSGKEVTIEVTVKLGGTCTRFQDLYLAR